MMGGTGVWRKLLDELAESAAAIDSLINVEGRESNVNKVQRSQASVCTSARGTKERTRRIGKHIGR
jgi:hypothetical protein